MKVLVYGSGGRDHCLADSYGDSQHVEKVYISPGNPGILYTSKGKRGLIEPVRLNDFNEVAAFCADNKVDLVDVGSENPLEEGLIDVLNGRGIRTVGPRKPDAPSAHPRPGYHSSGCVPAEPDFVSPDTLILPESILPKHPSME